MTARQAEYFAWARGQLPDFRPTRGQLHAFAQDLPEPVRPEIVILTPRRR